MDMVVTFLLLLVTLVCFLPSSSSSSFSHVSFSLTYIDAESSPVRRVEADPCSSCGDLAEGMPVREFVAAGRALRARMERQNHGGHALIKGRVSILKEPLGDLYLNLHVGTPPQQLMFLVDTGSELTWSPCFPCLVCSPFKAPFFVFSKSSSYSTVPCDSFLCTDSLHFNTTCNSTAYRPSCVFQVYYADSSFDAGSIALDSFRTDQFYFAKPFVFGCAIIDNDTVASPGVIGLSAGPFSFTSQLFGMYADMPKKFAYCLHDRFMNLNAHGTIEFGDYELPMNLSHMPMVPPVGPLRELYYFVELKGITVGKSLIKVDMKAGEGVRRWGTIFDSGTTLTQLGMSVYDELMEEMKKQTVNLRPFTYPRPYGGVDLCYRVPLNGKEVPKTKDLPKVPLVTLHFAGMVDLELEPKSLLYPVHHDDKSISLCLAFDSTPENDDLKCHRQLPAPKLLG